MVHHVCRSDSGKINMTNRKSSDQIFDLLDTSGLSRSFVESLLPTWWDHQATDNPAGLSEFKLLLSRNLGIDLQGLSNDRPEVVFKLPHVRKLKSSIRTNDQALSPAIAIALSVAKTVMSSYTKPYIPLPQAHQLRQAILEKYPNANYLSLRALIRTCWDHGIAVIYIANFPKNLPKMDGLVVHLADRPVILLSKNTLFSSWMSFILAHEMGHLAYNHCNQGEILIDDSLGEEQPNKNAKDSEELEADEYALTLLTGYNDKKTIDFNSLSPFLMAEKALARQRIEKIDAGHLILNYAYQTGEWRKSVAALKLLDQKKRAISDIQEAMFQEIDSNQLSEQALTYLSQMSGIEQAGNP